MSEAAQQALFDRMRQQLFYLLSTTSQLKVTLLLATSAGEVPDNVKTQLYNDLIQCAGMVEVRK